MEKNQQTLILRVSVNKDQGGCDYMEDSYSTFLQGQNWNDDTERVYAFFGVFDGHSGDFASSFARNNLAKEITKLPGFSSNDDDTVLESIKKGFLSCHELLKTKLIKLGKLSKDGRFTEACHSKVGTTATVVFVRNGKMFIGHAGDSRMVLGYKDAGCSDDIWKAKQLTKDHKPDDPEELARIISAGGKISININTNVSRIIWSYPTGYSHSNGPLLTQRPKFDGKPFDTRALNIARSLGDFWSFNEKTQEYVVSPVPDVSVFKLDVEKHRCLILGSDGLWDFVTPEEAVEEMRLVKNYNLQLENSESDYEHLPPRIKSARRLVEIALNRFSDNCEIADNITVIAIYLDQDGGSPGNRLIPYQV